MVTLVTPGAIAPTITRDRADDQVLVAELSTKADLIVSGGCAPRDLESLQGIKIVTAATAVGRVASGHMEQRPPSAGVLALGR